jgi:hypothetical protein
MLLKLPILINGKKINHNFKLNINNNKIDLFSLDNKKIINIICFNKGIYSKAVYLPLTFIINKNYIFNEFFFYTFVSDINKNDFFNIILNEINKKKNTKYKFYKYFNHAIIENIFKIYDKKYKIKYDFDNIDEFLNFTFYRVVYNLNKYLYLFYNNIQDNNIHIICKKTKTIITLIKNIKILYDNKEDFVFNIIDDNNVLDIINNLLIFKYDNLINITISKIYKINFYNDFYKYYLKNNIDYLIYLKLLKINIKNIPSNYKTYFNDILDITKDTISFELFKVIVNKDTNYNKDILNNLFLICNKISHLTLKNTITDTFKKILFYSCKFIKKINLKELNISNTIKHIYNICYEILKNITNKSFFKNYKKIYEKNIYTSIFKTIIFNDNFLEINNDILLYLQKYFNENYVCYCICKNLNYFFINYQIDYYKYIYNELNKNLLFFDILDIKIKEIIQKPYLLFNKLKDKLSILKWLQIISKFINLLYYQPIKIENNDIINLSELLYYFTKVNEQKITCTNYKNLIHIANKHKNLIIFNDRINLKINDIFIDKNINLGHLVKNIKNNSNIVFYDETENINKYKMKYLKYKGKYLLDNTN